MFPMPRSVLRGKIIGYRAAKIGIAALSAPEVARIYCALEVTPAKRACVAAK